MAPGIPGELAVMAEQVRAHGARAVVCAAAPLAAQIGAAVLRDGGNAYDAVVAMGLAETVLLPPKCGLGGDLVAIAAPAGAVEPRALIAVGGAPDGLAAVAERGGWREVGPTSVGPPAAPAGYLALAASGRLPFVRLARPAIELATDGFPWAAVCTRLSERAAALVAEMQPGGCVYYPEGVPIAPGTIVRLPGLARVLEELVTRREGFLDGPVGAAIVAAVAERGGVLTHADFRHARAEWVPCAAGLLGGAEGRRLWATPAPTHGPSLLDALGDARPTDGPADVYGRVLAAIARRRGTLADPSGTSMVSAVDSSGTAVVVVHSNSFPRFGSGIVVADYDLTLANRAGRGFTPTPGHPNFPVPGRRPATTLHAWCVADAAGAPRLLGATPGGANQMPWNAQLLTQVLAGVDDPGLLVASPRWEWLPDDDGVRIEAGFGADDAAALVAAAPRATTAARWGLTSAQQVVRVPRPGEAVVGAADPRTVGLALGV
jgi:gamma-glutamyltranspeptidase/glutathione hydrolase